MNLYIAFFVGVVAVLALLVGTWRSADVFRALVSATDDMNTAAGSALFWVDIVYYLSGLLLFLASAISLTGSALLYVCAWFLVCVAAALPVLWRFIHHPILAAFKQQRQASFAVHTKAM